MVGYKITYVVRDFNRRTITVYDRVIIVREKALKYYKKIVKKFGVENVFIVKLS